ncbi:MAG: hypothetical protein SGPRY_013235 [Prymnesium sp.]
MSASQARKKSQAERGIISNTKGKYGIEAAKARMYERKYKLDVSDLLACVKEPWEATFNQENTLKAWDKIDISPFTRRVYWELRDAKEKRAQVAAEASIGPELLTVQEMVRILFPGAAAPDTGSREHRRARDRDTLHSSDLWDLPGGATGGECFAKVKEKTEKRKAKEDAARQKKEQRVAQHEQRAATEIELGSRVVSALVHDAQMIPKLKVTQLHAALSFKGINYPHAALMPALIALLHDKFKLPMV